MLPLAVERAIAPPFSSLEEESRPPAVVSIAPVPPATESLIFPDVPPPEERESREPVVRLPLAVERSIAPPFPSLEEEARTPRLVSIAPVSPVIDRVMFPPVLALEETTEEMLLVVMLPPAVENVIAPPVPTVEEELRLPAVVSIAPVPPAERLILPPPAKMEEEFRVPVVMLPPAVERAIAPAFPWIEGEPEVAEESRLPAVVSIAPIPPATERLILPPPVPEEFEVREPVVMLPPAVERAIAPAFPCTEEAELRLPAVVSIAPVSPATERLILPPPVPEERESREPVVMLPPAVERAIAPPFPRTEAELRLPAVVSIAPVPPVTERSIFPPPKEEPDFRLLVVMLPPTVERVIAPPFSKVELDCRSPVVSIAPGPPVTLRVISPPVPAPNGVNAPIEKEVSFLVVMLPPPAVERVIAPPFPEVPEFEVPAVEFRMPIPAVVLIEPVPLVTEKVMFPPLPTGSDE